MTSSSYLFLPAATVPGTPVLSPPVPRHLHCLENQDSFSTKAIKRQPSINASLHDVVLLTGGCYTVGSIIYRQTATVFFFIGFQKSVSRPEIIFFTTLSTKRQIQTNQRFIIFATTALFRN
jgi:hypothetical protein